MKQSLLIGSALAALLTVLPAPASVGAAQETGPGEPRIAVLEFVDKTGGQKSKADYRRINGGPQAVQDVFVTELRKSGFVYDVSKEQMCDAVRRANNLDSSGDCEALLRAHNLTLSGDVDRATAVRVGKLLGVNYLLTGSVTEYGVTDRRARRDGRRFAVALSARLIDTSTGEIAWSDEARTDVSVGGFGGGVDDQRMFEKAMTPSIRRLADSLKGAKLSGKAGGRPAGR